MSGAGQHKVSRSAAVLLPALAPANCPHCEYDRKFPQTENGGWIYTGNNGPIVPCGMCNPDGKHPRS